MRRGATYEDKDLCCFDLLVPCTDAAGVLINEDFPRVTAPKLFSPTSVLIRCWTEAAARSLLKSLSPPSRAIVERGAAAPAAWSLACRAQVPC